MQELSKEHVTTPGWRNELHGAGLMNCIDVSLARRPAMRRFDVQIRSGILPLPVDVSDTWLRTCFQLISSSSKSTYHHQPPHQHVALLSLPYLAKSRKCDCVSYSCMSRLSSWRHLNSIPLASASQLLSIVGRATIRPSEVLIIVPSRLESDAPSD
ncbi:hypothetical protein IG631_12330 [Alternaria alternata]|nr:hypothetical protein IG631_12330 [Alternaria alternata]